MLNFRPKLYQMLIFCFVFFNISDILTTIYAGNKHGFEYEMNPIYIMTGSIYIMFIIKIIIVWALVYIMEKKYYRLTPTITRYIFIYAMVLLTILLMSASIGNYKIYLEDNPGRPYTTEEKIEYQKEIIMNVKYMQPETVVPTSMPVGQSILMINILQFLIWSSFEKWKIQTTI